jgi:tripartite-type tricarboxylate transporter receptor subunit TctC
VPYSGATLAVTALISGDLAVIFPNVPVIAPQIKAGRVRGLAVTGAKRSPVLPELPTMAEAGLPGFEVSGFLGLLAPARTPPAIIRQLSAEIAKISKQKDFVDRFAAFGWSRGGAPENATVSPVSRSRDGRVRAMGSGLCPAVGEPEKCVPQRGERQFSRAAICCSSAAFC